MKDYAAEALAIAAASVEGEKYPQAWRFVIGLKQDWESRKAAKVAARESPTDEG